MRPTTADDNVFDFNALLHPGTVFEAPQDVVDHPALTLAEKRAILASWASDASAMVSCPSMRPCRAQEAGFDRRDPGRIARPGRWPANTARRKALPPPLDRACGSGVKFGA